MMEEEKEVSSKKRVAGREISRDNPGLEDDDGPEPEMGTFKRASGEVMANRRIVKVRRQQQPLASSSNPFANISFVAPTKPTEKIDSPAAHDQSVPEKSLLEEQDNANNEQNKALEEKATENGVIVDGKNATEGKAMELNSNSDNPAPEKNNADEPLPKGNDKEALQECQGGDTDEAKNKTTENSEGEDKDETIKEVREETKEAEKGVKTGGEKQDGDHKDKAEPTACLSSFQQLSSNQNAFTGLAGTGFSGSSFSFGSFSKDGPAFGFSVGSVFGQQNEKSPFPAFGIGSSNNGGSSVQIFGFDVSDATKAGGSSTPALQEVAVETGEENEKVVFNADAILFEYIDGGWKERGKGEIRVNVSTLGDERARLVMRARGNYRLILNSSIYPDMSLKIMDKRGITFACVNSTSEGKGGLTTFALKFKESLIMEDFRETVTTYKEKKGDTILKTPENSPKASDD